MQVTTLDPLTTQVEANPYKQSLTSDFDNFLSMLTTQLQNQDPLSPMDSTEFTNQLVQFSQLEQQINQSEKLDDLLAAQKASETTAALGYLGNEIEMLSHIAMLTQGQAKFAYSLPSGAESATVTIVDEDGNTVRTFDAELEAGRHDLTWDGTNNQGVQLPDGAYSVRVSATDENDDPLTDINVYTRGTVDEIINDAGTTYVKVGDVLVPLDRIVSVSPEDAPAA